MEGTHETQKRLRGNTHSLESQRSFRYGDLLSAAIVYYIFRGYVLSFWLGNAVRSLSASSSSR
jgi:hypothetical protein